LGRHQQGLIHNKPKEKGIDDNEVYPVAIFIDSCIETIFNRIDYLFLFLQNCYDSMQIFRLFSNLKYIEQCVKNMQPILPKY